MVHTLAEITIVHPIPSEDDLHKVTHLPVAIRIGDVVRLSPEQNGPYGLFEIVDVGYYRDGVSYPAWQSALKTPIFEESTFTTNTTLLVQVKPIGRMPTFLLDCDEHGLYGEVIALAA